MKKYLAQIPLSPDSETPLHGPGPLGSPGENALLYFTNFMSGVIGLLTLIAGVWFIFTIFIGAIGIIGAGGDPKKVEGARGKIVTGIIGIVIVISAVFLIDLIGSFFGLNILNPAEYFLNIVPGLG